MSTLEIFLIVFSILLLTGLFFSLFYLFKARMALAKAQVETRSEEALSDRFRVLAAESLESNSQQFLQLAKMALEKESTQSVTELDKRKVEIQHLVAPLQEKLNTYQTQIQNIEKDRQRSYTSVEQELKRIAEINDSLNKETRALKNALKRPHIRGRWGEVQLRNCIELAGMSEFADVNFQTNTTLDDGSRIIPDMTVRMPGGRIVVVDAKTPIDAFMSSLEATDDETRTTELARHGKHVKEHIKKLSSRAYTDHLKNSADFTVMFLPNESFLYAALEAEPDLVEYAIQKKILVSTPPTLIGLLKVIRYGWNEERLAENAQKISETGAELHKRLADFIDGFISIGKHLDRAKQEYDLGFTRLESRVLTQAKRLEKLGAKSAKTLPISSKDDDEIETEDTSSSTETQRLTT